ncbi:FAD-dependent oxidoreductase [Glaciecola sp. 1036]|uniref:FAD-dependent oxidoreductase n=1 Tax=Alteromonadaceae TaxID=72275 RepID=UPI003D032FCF
MSEFEQVDIVIAGGGVAGCAAALALAKNTDYSVAVIEKYAPSASDIHPSFDARVIALAAESIKHLHSFGMDISDIPSSSIKHIHVSDRHHCAQVALSADELGVKSFGQVVRLETLGLSLYEQLSGTKINYFADESIQSLQQHKDSVSINTSNRKLNAKLLIIAEGANSPTREKLNFVVEQKDYQQTAIIANVQTQLPHQGRAFERFTKYGPIAFLPMEVEQGQNSQHLMSVVWSLGDEMVEEVKGLSDEDFCQRLQTLFGSRLGSIHSPSPRFQYPLSLKVVPDFVQHRVVCIANAAQSLHPIAGQGFNTGIRDISDLVKSLRGQDPGVFGNLSEYKKRRRKDKTSIITATDSLVRVFSNHYLPTVVGRSAGLQLMNHSSLLQKAFVRYAMGER